MPKGERCSASNRSQMNDSVLMGMSLYFDHIGRVGLLDSGQSCTSAVGRTAPVGFGALPDPLANVRQSHLRLFGQLQGIINFDAEVAHGAFELGVPKQ